MSAEKYGYNFSTVAPATADATSQLPFIKAEIQRGVDVIAISPNSNDALNTVFDQARKKGIIVMVVNGDIPGSEDHRDVAIMPVDFSTVGNFAGTFWGSTGSWLLYASLELLLIVVGLFFGVGNFCWELLRCKSGL